MKLLVSFLAKDYEQAKFSDIINGLDGLTKGIIYPYFDSKEDIFIEVVKNIGMRKKTLFDDVKFSKELTGSEKITNPIYLDIDNENMEQIVSISPIIFKKSICYSLLGASFQ